MDFKSHSTSIISEKAVIGSGVEIGPYAIVGANVVLKNNVFIGSHVVIDGHTTIGEGTKIFPFASIGAAPQDLKFHGEPSTLIIGSNNIVREFVTLQPGTESGKMTTVIGDNNLFMANTHVGHDCEVGNNNIFANSSALAGHVTIGNKVTLGGLSAVHQFCKIGDFAFLGGGSMIAQDFPPFCIGQGDRAMVRGLNLVGLERGGLTTDDIQKLKKVFRTLFVSKGQWSEKLESIEQELLDNPYVLELMNFIRSSKRGVCSSKKN